MQNTNIPSIHLTVTNSSAANESRGASVAKVDSVVLGVDRLDGDAVDRGLAQPLVSLVASQLLVFRTPSVENLCNLVLPLLHCRRIKVASKSQIFGCNVWGGRHLCDSSHM